jgi:hypothetical protein
MLEAAKTSSGATSVVKDNATAGTASTVICHSIAGEWAASAPLKAEAGKYWCVDSTGASKQTDAPLPASDYSC